MGPASPRDREERSWTGAKMNCRADLRSRSIMLLISLRVYEGRELNGVHRGKRRGLL